MTSVHELNRAALDPLRAAQHDWDETTLRRALREVLAPKAACHLGHPFRDMTGSEEFHDRALSLLKPAWPDVERRDWIVVAGGDDHGHDRAGCGDHFTGTFMAPFADIPPTGDPAHMRFHESCRLESGRIAEFQAFWDVPKS